jgi:hypothetical protein
MAPSQHAAVRHEDTSSELQEGEVIIFACTTLPNYADLLEAELVAEVVLAVALNWITNYNILESNSESKSSGQGLPWRRMVGRHSCGPWCACHRSVASGRWPCGEVGCHRGCFTCIPVTLGKERDLLHAVLLPRYVSWEHSYGRCSRSLEIPCPGQMQILPLVGGAWQMLDGGQVGEA